MKKAFLIFLVALVSWSGWSQDPTYLTFELMKVDEGMGSDYWDTESFWEKLHEQRVKNGDIIGWDLWALSPSGTGQGHQYMTVTLYNDPVKMMQGGDLNKAMDGAYPNMSQVDRDSKMDQTVKSRDLAVVVYLQQIASAGGDYEMPLGTLAQINFMKANPGKASAYEEMESSMFKGMHEQRVAAGGMAMWGLLRNMLGYTTEAYASHITVDMYKDWDQYFNGSADIEWTPAQQKAYDDIAEIRDLKSTVFGTLVKKVR
ncbi:MAG: hypothetical protein KJP14_08630 [Eudoraea sp.]|nr:hypothetical protein [Eudoraea sp.]MBT8210580.1 hypothetical protein [Eudoraea sp.]NNK29435.1 hypothetical protein [Flavobacteriaceae bacterium]